MTPTTARLPKQLVWTVLVLSALPFLLSLAGADFSVRADILVGSERWGFTPEELIRFDNEAQAEKIRASELIHTILEWSAFLVALFTAVFAFTHYHIERDVTTPIIGTALLFSGMIDAFHTLAADRLITTFADNRQFIPFTWAISRTFNVCILIAGTAPFLWNKRAAADAATRQRGLRYILLVSVLFGLTAYSIIHILARLPQLPRTVYPEAIVVRPWDCIPLVLYLVAGGIILPRFHRMHPNRFSHGLIVSIIPHVAAQAHAAFGSSALFDNHFNIAHALKILAYLVPLAGLILDYVRAYQTGVLHRATEEKLRVARDVQQGLLPQSAPQLTGFDLAGVSYPADAVGGDYFDYIPMRDGQLGIVVADVSGHEIGASILMAQTRAYLRALSLVSSDLGKIISQVNRFLAQDVRARWFVTLFFAQFDPATRSFTFAAAGHRGYLLDASGNVTTFESLSPPLGVVDEGAVPCGPATLVKPDDLLLLMTDGIDEATAPDGEQFGLSRALDFVTANRAESAENIVNGLYREVQSFRKGAPQVDDVTVVVLKRTSDDGEVEGQESSEES